MIESSSPEAPSSGVSHVDALTPGTRLAEFEIVSLLGVGGFGMVYKAFDHSLHRAVAIKEYMPSALAGRAQGQSLWVRSSSDQQTFQTGLSSFVDEARLLAQFDHPSLVKVFRFWEANNTAYMVMPLYVGMTFKQARAQMRTPPPEAWLRKLLWSVLGALRVLHDGKTLHRDISPDNIFLQDNGPPVLLDLGAARHAINDQDRKHTAVLKVNYAPIEQYADGDEDLRQGPWSDLYSLAAVVHGCLCNDTPLPATLRSIRDRMVPFSRVAKTVKRQFGVEYSVPFVTAISQALSLRPENRPQNIDAFLQAMEMTAPPEGLQQFDFRADLGDIWVEPADHLGPDLVTPTVDVTSAPKVVAEIQAQAARALSSGVADSNARVHPRSDDSADTVMLDAPDTVMIDAGDTVFIDAGDTVAAEDSRLGEEPTQAEPPPRHHARQDRRTSHAEREAERAAKSGKGPKRSAVVWLAVASVAVVVAAAGWRWSHPASEPKDDIITEMADPSPAVVPVETAMLEPAAADASAAAASAAAPVSEPASAPASAAAPRPVVKSAPKKVAAEPAPAPVVVQEETAPEPPPVAAAPRPKPAPVRVPTPQEACADANFLARPMCIHQECQKPSQVNQPICVENRRRYEAEEQRRRQTPN